MTQQAGKKVGVVLSGCGVYDGSEIHEAVITLLAIDRAGAQAICMAPDVSQLHVIDHFNGEPNAKEVRSVLVESARIARGEIKKMNDIKAANLDALIFPGGYGAAKNLCTFAVDGADCKVNADVERLIKEMHQAKKPMGFICIAPVIAAKVLGKFQPRLTIGNDPGTSRAIEQMGGKHLNCKVEEVAIDDTNRIASTPAYMLGPTVSHVAQGIDKCVAAVLNMIK